MALNTSERFICAASAIVTFPGATSPWAFWSTREGDNATPIPGDAAFSMTMNRYTINTKTPTSSMDELDPK